MNTKFITSIALCTLLLLMGVTALAVGVWGDVNWLGEAIPHESVSPPPEPTPAPENLPLHDEHLELINQIFDSRNSRELVVVYDSEHSASSAPRRQILHSLDEFNSFMDSMPNLPVPNNIPEGYAFEACELFFDCLPDGEFLLTSQEEIMEGIQVEKYSVNEALDFISGYDLQLRNLHNAEDYISIYVKLNPLSDITDHSFGVNADQSAQVLTVDGMDNAISILSDNHVHIAMRRALNEPLQYLKFV